MKTLLSGVAVPVDGAWSVEVERSVVLGLRFSPFRVSVSVVRRRRPCRKSPERKAILSEKDCDDD